MHVSTVGGAPLTTYITSICPVSEISRFWLVICQGRHLQSPFTPELIPILNLELPNARFRSVGDGVLCSTYIPACSGNLVRLLHADTVIVDITVSCLAQIYSCRPGKGREPTPSLRPGSEPFRRDSQVRARLRGVFRRRVRYGRSNLPARLTDNGDDLVGDCLPNMSAYGDIPGRIES